MDPAISAAAVDINPSTRTGFLHLHAPRIRPASSPISNPPTFDNTSNPSSESDLFLAKARSITETVLPELLQAPGRTNFCHFFLLQ